MSFLSNIEVAVMLAVHELADDAYGAEVRRTLEETTGRAWSVGAAYVPLDRLTRAGLLEARDGGPVPERGGRARRYYNLTSQGHTALAETKRAHDALWERARHAGAFGPERA